MLLMQFGLAQLAPPAIPPATPPQQHESRWAEAVHRCFIHLSSVQRTKLLPVLRQVTPASKKPFSSDKHIFNSVNCGQRTDLKLLSLAGHIHHRHESPKAGLRTPGTNRIRSAKTNTGSFFSTGKCTYW